MQFLTFTVKAHLSSIVYVVLCCVVLCCVVLCCVVLCCVVLCCVVLCCVVLCCVVYVMWCNVQFYRIDASLQGGIGILIRHFNRKYLGIGGAYTVDRLIVTFM